MNKFKTLLAAIVLLCTTLMGAALGVGNPAQALPTNAHRGTFNDVTHASGDTGYTAPIHIICNDGRHAWLYVGESSPGKCGFHVARIVVALNQTVYCKNSLPPYQNIYYYTGNYNAVPTASSLKCYMQRPL